MANVATFVAQEGERLVRVLARWGMILAIAVVIGPSSAYMFLALDHEGEDFEAALDRRAMPISRMVYANPALWSYEIHRIKDAIEPLRSEQGSAVYRVEVREGERWRLVAEVGDAIMGPSITREVPILDGDKVIGRVAGTHDVRHILEDVLLVALSSFLLGLGVFLLIQFKAIPFLRDSIARLSRHESELAANRADLERQVNDRTTSLRDTNERLSRSLGELRAQQRENERLATIAQRVDSGIVIMDPNGVIEWVNPGFTAMTGYTLEEAVGRKGSRLLNGPDTDSETIRKMADAFRRGESFAVEILHYTKSGVPKWVDLTSTMLRDDGGEVQRCIAIGRDVTPRKHQEQRIAEALEREREINQQQRRFVSVVSHEFRTPLTIIDGAAQRLARNADRFAPDDVRERVEKIRRAVARMGELIETTLSAARLDSGAIDVKAAAVDLGAMLAGVVERIRSIAAEFEIALDLPAAPVVVSGDSRLLDQVLTNLLTNAVKYSAESRRVELVLRAGDGQAYVSIRDHGLGIPADELPRLFTRFYRASTARGLPGTGIGLNLARDLVAMHDGEITVESEVGLGSTFTVRLPLAAPDASVRAA